MYLNQIVIYLTWPLFIILSWIIIKSALILYERKFKLQKDDKNIPSDKSQHQ